ncbi:hypothetical protein GH714_016890 [Hevea brasiliensis]|uniref:Protein TIC 20 n=1 Tax=Hevea brasiliensis TaxID=3981 RepID=A0A6A6KC45_HEVBR|nr:hypothetical protein GH714_016890 [Hevea brasiliensis]
MSYNPTPATERLISAVAYTLPFFNSLQYGRFFAQYPSLGLLFDPLIPLLNLYRSIPYASFVAFFALYLGVVRNPSFSQYVRFNSMQAVTLDVLLVVPLLLARIFNPGRSGLGFKLMVWGHNAVFLFSCFCFVYGLVSCVLGKTPYLPFVGEAAGADARVITLQNKCNNTIWPAFQVGSGLYNAHGEIDGGFELRPGESVNVTAEDYAFIWVEMVSVHNGFNLPISILPYGSPAAECKTSSCFTNLNQICPNELQVRSNGSIVACMSPCLAFNKPEFCCARGRLHIPEYPDNDDCKPTNYSVAFEAGCPTASTTAALELSKASKAIIYQQSLVSIFSRMAYWHFLLLLLISVSGQSVNINAPQGWSGRIWARTGCSFDSSGRGKCITGDCGGILRCAGAGGKPQASLAEFTLDSPIDYYDVSLVDGFNLPFSILPSGGKVGCKTTHCVSNLNRECPGNLQLKWNGQVVACKSACLAFGKPEYCCTGDYSSPQTCKPTNYSKVFKTACPTAYSYAYDDPSSTFTCKGANYWIRFC